MVAGGDETPGVEVAVLCVAEGFIALVPVAAPGDDPEEVVAVVGAVADETAVPADWAAWVLWALMRGTRAGSR